MPNFAYLDANFWFKINLDDQSSEDSRWYLESSRTQIDTIKVYFENEDGSFIEYASGDLYPYDSRIIKHKNFVFPIPKLKMENKSYMCGAKEISQSNSHSP